MSNTYIDIYMQHNHPRKRSNGCVSEHILVAEKTLGRYLVSGEVVHHIDENKRNNVPENLQVFKTQSDHSRFHKGSYMDIVECDDGSWECLASTLICSVCGKEFYEISQGSKLTYCSPKCGQLKSRTCDRPSSGELRELLIDGSFLAVGKQFGVSDNAVRKWCRQYDMSDKARDYK